MTLDQLQDALLCEGKSFSQANFLCEKIECSLQSSPQSYHESIIQSAMLMHLFYRESLRTNLITRQN